MKQLTSKLILLALTLSSGLAFAGASGGGGGQAIVFRNGSVRFLDLIPDSELPKSSQEALNYNETLNEYYSQDRFVKQLGRIDPDFFQCAIRIMTERKQESQAYVTLINYLNSTIAIQLQLQIVTTQDEASYNKLDIPIPLVASPSDRVNVSWQQGLATFSYNQVGISSRLYIKLNDVDRCGLSIHEAFRQMNFAGILREALTTKEIEVATRYLMNRTQNNVDEQTVLKIALAKIASPNPTMEFLQRAAEEFSNKLSSLRKALDIEIDPLKREILHANIEDLDEKLDDLIVEAWAIYSNEPSIRQIQRMGVLVPHLVNEVLTSKLQPGCEYFDVLNSKKLFRCK